VKAFILSICLAVVFAILLVSANTMAMSIRERTREVALLKTLGFTRRKILGLFVGEAVSLAVLGGVLGTLAAFVLVGGMARQGGFLTGMRVTPPTMLVALLVAALVDRKSTRLNSSHVAISYAVFCLKKKKKKPNGNRAKTVKVITNITPH